MKALEFLKIVLPRVDWTYASKAHAILNEQYNKRVSAIQLQIFAVCCCL